MSCSGRMRTQRSAQQWQGSAVVLILILYCILICGCALNRIIEIFENPQKAHSVGFLRIPRNSRQKDIEFTSNTPRIWRAGFRHTLQTTRQPTTFDDLNYVRDNQTHRRRVSRNAPKMIDFRASTSSAVMSRTIRVGSNALDHRSTSYTNGVLELG